MNKMKLLKKMVAELNAAKTPARKKKIRKAIHKHIMTPNSLGLMIGI